MKPTMEVRKRYRENNRETINENNKRTNKFAFRYKNKTIYLGYNPRKGVCLKCGKEGKTVLHHEKYDDQNPLAHTTEVCYKCHKKIHDDIHKRNQEDANSGKKLKEWFENSKLETVKEHKIVERLEEKIKELEPLTSYGEIKSILQNIKEEKR